MKAMLFLLLSAALAAGESIEIVPRDGKPIQATVLEGDDDSFRCLRDDGAEFTIGYERLKPYSAAKVRRIVEEIATAPILVEHVATKKIGGEYRYFFRIFNRGADSFSGKVGITLQNRMEGITNGKTSFATTEPMVSRGGTTVYFDAYTGPAEVHGEASVAGFSYEVRRGDKVTQKGSGTISKTVTRS